MTTEKTTKKQKLRNAEYYDFQMNQDELYRQSKDGKIFKHLVDIISSEQNIKLAFRNIKKNRGSHTAGVDNKNIEDLAKWQDEALIKHVKRKFQWYEPQAVRRVQIPKSNDSTKTRPLGIPTIMDRLIQQCILQILEPICEAKFYNKNNGFRPNRSCEHALAQAEKNMQLSKLHFVVDIDIKGFFDNVNHGKLLKQLWTIGIRDKKLISILSAMLKAEIADIGFPEKGSPQGSIISPLLSNVVLNELDWWISSQWETIPTRKEFKQHKGHSGGRLQALKKTNLKECRLVRYADDFKIFCRKKKDAEKIFIATEKWLKDRLGLSISPEKSKIVNLKKEYSEFLGFKLKVTRKGKYSNGKPRFVVRSHLSDKSVKKIHINAKRRISDLQKPSDKQESYKAVQNYNSFVLGVHNYYSMATHASLDFAKIAFPIGKILKGRLQGNISKERGICSEIIRKRYGKSKQLAYVYGFALIPISYVQHKTPLDKKLEINQYTPKGRMLIHKQLGQTINPDLLKYLMLNPIKGKSIEYNDNRLSLFCAQKGKCAITSSDLTIGNMHCHHKLPLKLGGNDGYNNLVFVTIDSHKLIHASNPVLISELLQNLNLSATQLGKINVLRKQIKLPIIE